MASKESYKKNAKHFYTKIVPKAKTINDKIYAVLEFKKTVTEEFLSLALGKFPNNGAAFQQDLQIVFNSEIKISECKLLYPSSKEIEVLTKVGAKQLYTLGFKISQPEQMVQYIEARQNFSTLIVNEENICQFLNACENGIKNDDYLPHVKIWKRLIHLYWQSYLNLDDKSQLLFPLLTQPKLHNSKLYSV